MTSGSFLAAIVFWIDATRCGSGDGKETQSMPGEDLADFLIVMDTQIRFHCLSSFCPMWDFFEW